MKRLENKAAIITGAARAWGKLQPSFLHLAGARVPRVPSLIFSSERHSETYAGTRLPITSTAEEIEK